MADSTSDSIAKLDRALRHLKDLQAAVTTFIESGAYATVTDLDFQTGEIGIFGRVLREPPAVEWGAFIGDVTHNLRSALDNLIWQLTLSRGHVPPDKLNRKWRRIQFPIITDPTEWEGPHGTERLWGVDPTLHARFKALQPFFTGQGAPEREPLAVLQELSNIDKHRHVNLTQCHVSLEDALSFSAQLPPTSSTVYGSGGYDSTKPNNNIIERFDIGSGMLTRWDESGNVIEHQPMVPEPMRVFYEVIEEAEAGPFKDGTKLGAVRPRIEPGDWMVGSPYMDVNPVLSFYIAFDQGPPANGASLIGTLETLHDCATNIVREFAPEFSKAV